MGKKLITYLFKIRKDVKMSKRKSLILFFIPLLAVAVFAGKSERVVSFDEVGMVVDIRAFFNAASSEIYQPAIQTDDGVSGRALVTASGIYTFLETPANAKHLKTVQLGTAVHVKGQLLKSGSLLHIESLEQVMEEPEIAVSAYAGAEGEEVTLQGVNKCQCGLDVASLPHNCQLGHLHHLEAEDGRIYHYLPFLKGGDTFLGTGSHFKAVTIRGKEFPGGYLLVEAVSVRDE